MIKQFDEEKAKQIKLFYDSNKTPKSSKDLLKPDENRPSYMWSFEIHQDFKQYAGELSFMSDTLVYDNIILANWQNITEYFIKTEPTNNEVVKFYEYIKSLFPKKDSKPLIAAGKAFIYTNNQDFELREAVFYNKNTALAQAEDVIEKLTSKDFPITEIMSYLSADSASPFAIPTENSITKEDKIESNALLSKSEVEKLLDFCVKNGKERIFDIGYFDYQSSNNKYYFHLDDSNSQFYVNRMEELKKYVEDYFTDDYHLLEKTFKPEYYQLGLLNTEIIERIIKKLGSIEEQYNKLEIIYDFIDIIRKDTVDIDLKEKYVKLIERLDFDSKENYSRHSFEYKFLKLGLLVIRKKSSNLSKEEVNTDSLIQDLRAKVYIDSISLNSLKVLKKFKLKLNEQFSIEISPTEIISISDNSKLIKTISDQFKDDKGSDDRELKENIFIEVDKDEISTFNDFKRQENKVIDTFEKFIFISYKEKKPLNTIEDYKIESLNSIGILKGFYQNIFKPNFKSTKESDTNKLPLWFKNYFGFNKKNYVFHNWATQEELLPNDILSWVKTKQEERDIKESFLHNLGINTTKSNIITFRDRLDRNNRINETQYNTIKGALQNKKKLLNNTLVWYANKVKGQKLNRQKNNTSLDILKDIYENIAIDTSTILPWITEVNGTNISIELNQYNIETKPIAFYNLHAQDQKRWQRIFEILQSKGHLLIANELLPNVDFIENSQKIELTSTIDEEKLKDADSWNEEYYNLWKSNNDNNPIIKIYQDKIPYVDTFLGEVVGVSVNEKNDNDGYFDTENNTVYIKKCQDLGKKLKEVLDDKDVSLFTDLQIFKNVQELQNYLENPSEEQKEFSSFNLLAHSEIVKEYVIKWLQENKIEFGKGDNRLSLVYELYTYQKFDEDLPFIFMKVNNTNNVYYLDKWNKERVHSFVADNPNDLQKAFDTIVSNGHQMIDNKYWDNKYNTDVVREKLVLTPKVHLDSLRSDDFREKWSINQYEQWAYKDEVKVYFVEEGIPYKDYFYDDNTVFNEKYIRTDIADGKYWCEDFNELYLIKSIYDSDEKIINVIRHHCELTKWNKLINALEGGIVSGEIAELINKHELTAKDLEYLIKKKNRSNPNNGGSGQSNRSNTKEIGNRGEEHIYNILKNPNQEKLTLKQWFNKDFVKRYGIETVRDEKKPYDMTASDENGEECYIECKSTTYTEPLFYLSAREWNKYLNCREQGKKYILFRVFNLNKVPSYRRYDDILEAIEQGLLVPYINHDKTIKGYTVHLCVKEHM